MESLMKQVIENVDKNSSTSTELDYNPFAVFIFWMAKHPKNISIESRDKLISKMRLFFSDDPKNTNQLENSITQIQTYFISDCKENKVPQELWGILKNYIQIYSPKSDAFERTDLSDLLVQQKAKEIILFGYGGSTWIFNTAKTALEKEYPILTIENAMLDIKNQGAKQAVLNSQNWYKEKGKVYYGIRQLKDAMRKYETGWESE